MRVNPIQAGRAFNNFQKIINNSRANVMSGVSAKNFSPAMSGKVRKVAFYYVLKVIWIIKAIRIQVSIKSDGGAF